MNSYLVVSAGNHIELTAAVNRALDDNYMYVVYGPVVVEPETPEFNRVMYQVLVNMNRLKVSAA
jgi:hypothetical protein